jgi:hypothetical protein
MTYNKCLYTISSKAICQSAKVDFSSYRTTRSRSFIFNLFFFILTVDCFSIEDRKKQHLNVFFLQRWNFFSFYFNRILCDVTKKKFIEWRKVFFLRKNFDGKFEFIDWLLLCCEVEIINNIIVVVIQQQTIHTIYFTSQLIENNL